MFYFSYYWILRYLKLSEIVMSLFLMMTILSMMPWNVWGEEIYTYTDKDGTMVITNIPPHENINSNTRNSNSDQDSTPRQEKINSDTKNSNSFQDSTREKRLHWGRDKALIDAQKKSKNGQHKTVNDGGGIDDGVYKVKIKKIGSNLYQDFYTNIIIKTRACVELAGWDEALLDWSGVSGELFFRNMKKSCIVKKVYK
jgi:hypothetical protein